MTKGEMEKLIDDTFFDLKIHSPLTKEQMLAKIKATFDNLLIKKKKSHLKLDKQLKIEG